jgi:hypothetical protein
MTFPATFPKETDANDMNITTEASAEEKACRK